MAAIVPDPSSSSLCTADLLLIKPPAPLFPPFPSFFIYSFQKVVADTAIRLRPYRFADTISPPWRGDRRCGAFSIGKNRGRIVSRISIAIRPFKEEIFPVDRCLPRGSSGLLSGQTIARLLFDTIV